MGDGHRVAFKLQYSHWDQLETGELQANEIRGRSLGRCTVSWQVKMCKR